MDKYCETKLISKMDIYFKTEEVVKSWLIFYNDYGFNSYK